MTKRGEAQAAAARGLMSVAFAHRTLPSVLTDSKQLSDSEYEEVMSFQGVCWQDDAVAAWARWPEIVRPDGFRRNTYARVRNTLTLLKERARLSIHGA